IEGVDHRHVGGEIDHDLELLRALRKDEPRDPVAVWVLLPVQKMPGRLDVERVAEDRRAAMRRRPQPDFVRAQVDEAVELVGRSMLERDADRHASSPRGCGYSHSGFGNCANTRRSPSPHCVWIIWKYGSDSSTRRCILMLSELVSYTTRSIGSPTEIFERMVESKDTIVHLVASRRPVVRFTTRSITGLPYLLSPIWK